jgi:hypothetical protein
MASAKFPNQAGGSQHRKNNGGGREAFSLRVHPSNRFNRGRNRSELGGRCQFRWKDGRLSGRTIIFLDPRAVKVGDVSPNGKIYPKLVPVSRIVVVLSDSLAHLAGGHADYRIIVAVIVRSPAKEFDAENSLFETVFLSAERLLDDMPEKWGISLTLAEERARQHPFKLTQNQLALLRTQGPSSGRGIFGHRHRYRTDSSGRAPLVGRSKSIGPIVPGTKS